MAFFVSAPSGREAARRMGGSLVAWPLPRRRLPSATGVQEGGVARLFRLLPCKGLTCGPSWSPSP